MEQHMNVKGMTCGACEQLVQDALLDEGATKVNADHKSGQVIVECNDELSMDTIVKVIEQEGYEVVK